MVNNELNLFMGKTFKDQENFIVPQAQQSSDKEIYQTERDYCNNHCQAIMEYMSLEQGCRMRNEPDNSSGKATAESARMTAVASASTFRRGG